MILDIRYRESNKENHLGFLVGRFKGVTTFIYGKLKREGKVPDVGAHLWQFDYWDNLISSEEEFRNFELYIRNNPKNRSRERWGGAVTQYMLGEESLLNFPMRAFVASREFATAGLAPRRFTLSERGTLVPLASDLTLISTFTSAQEREVLRRAFVKQQPIIHVCSQGIPSEAELSVEQKKALEEKRLLLISPQPSGSRLNKQVATWCNEYVLRHAAEIWVGDISPCGMLATMLEGIKRERN